MIVFAFIVFFLCVMVAAILRVPDTHGGSSGYVAGPATKRHDLTCAFDQTGGAGFRSYKSGIEMMQSTSNDLKEYDV